MANAELKSHENKDGRVLKTRTNYSLHGVSEIYNEFRINRRIGI